MLLTIGVSSGQALLNSSACCILLRALRHQQDWEGRVHVKLELILARPGGLVLTH